MWRRQNKYFSKMGIEVYNYFGEIITPYLTLTIFFIVYALINFSKTPIAKKHERPLTPHSFF